ncbi:MAG: response regulator [Chitinophagales bacterium]|nr:response regulator [Chitinophagales bacterium]MDW8393086.1 response regulator [Chitinophagales bacterium]
MHSTVLLVDDDIAFSTVVKNSLENVGYRVLHASQAAEARSILAGQANDIEVMLLDWSLPDTSGIDLLRELKREKGFEHIQVIMQTVMSRSEDIREGIDAGVFFYLVKPVEKSLLHSAVRAAASDYRRRRHLLSQLEAGQRPLRLLHEAEFRFRSIEEGDQLAAFIAQECPRPEEAILISELFANAVEYGHLNFTYEEKTKLLNDNTFAEEVQRRLSLRENANKFVRVWFQRLPDRIQLVVQDMGPGFDYEKYLRIDPNRITDNHGRGIAILNSLYPLRYIGRGNRVVLNIPLSLPSPS